MEIPDGNWSFKTLSSDKSSKEILCDCTYLYIKNNSTNPISFDIGGGQIELKANEAITISNTGVKITQNLNFKFGTGTISVVLIKAELA